MKRLLSNPFELLILNWQNVSRHISKSARDFVVTWSWVRIRVDLLLVLVEYYRSAWWKLRIVHWTWFRLTFYASRSNTSNKGLSFTGADSIRRLIRSSWTDVV